MMAEIYYHYKNVSYIKNITFRYIKYQMIKTTHEILDSGLSDIWSRGSPLKGITASLSV